MQFREFCADSNEKIQKINGAKSENQFQSLLDEMGWRGEGDFLPTQIPVRKKLKVMGKVRPGFFGFRLRLALLRRMK